MAGSRAGRSALSLAGRALAGLFGFVNLSLLARYLGVENFGIYIQLLTVVGLLEGIARLGIHEILVRDIAARPDRTAQLLGAGLIVRFLLFPLYVTLLALLNVTKLLSEVSTWSVVFLGCSQYIMIWTSTWTAALQANRRIGWDVFLVVIQRGITVALILLAIWMSGELSVYIEATAVAFLIAAGITLIIGIGVLGRPDFSVRMDQLKLLLSDSLPLGISLYVRLGIWRLPVLIVAVMAAQRDIGFFGGIQGIVQRTALVPIAVMTVALPAMAAAAAQSLAQLRREYTYWFKLVVVFGGAVTVLLVIKSEWAVVLLLGAEFSPAAVAFKILAPVMLLLTLNILLQGVLSSVGRQRLDTIALIAGLSLNILLTISLVPSLGFVGAAWGMLAGEAFIFLLKMAFMSSVTHSRLTSSRAILWGAKLGLILAGAATILIALQSNLVLALILSTLFYTFFVIRLGVLNYQEVHAFLGGREVAS